MKKALFALLGIFVIISFVGSVASACYTSCIGCEEGEAFLATDGTNVRFWTGKAYTWHFDLDNDILNIGDVNPEDKILEAYLWIDIDDWDCSIEYAKLKLDGTTVWAKEVDDKVYSLNVLAEVVNGHDLEVLIKSQGGDFKVDFLKIAGCYEDNNPVPEPASMLLLGTGLMGLVGVRRKLAKK